MNGTPVLHTYRIMLPTLRKKLFILKDLIYSVKTFHEFSFSNHFKSP